MSKPVPDFLTKALEARQNAGNLRSLPKSGTLVDFSSNDYLGLAGNVALSGQIKARLDREGFVPNGGSGSRLLSGNHVFYDQLEKQLATVFNAEKALVFNSGYVANMGLVSTVAGRGDTILYDQLAHVCLKEGAWLSKAESFAFGHNDLQDLEAKLSRAKGNAFVLTETVFSMDGDIAPLPEIIELCKKYQAYLIVDEAHSTGCYGENGGGWLIEHGLADKVFARVYTFGKAVGVHGACVAGSGELIDYLINFGRSFIYTTSLPPHTVISIGESFKFIQENSDLLSQLKDRIEFFRQTFQDTFKKPATSNTAIQPVMISGNDRCRAVASGLQNRGLDIRPILAPTVKKGTERLRISLHVHNTEEEIERMLTILHDVLS